ncbi:hypothetical protein VPHK406_0089 [Vibrio phage K406]
MTCHITKEEIIKRAKEYYYRHKGYKEEMFPYLWEQCSQDYQKCWIDLARIDLEDEFRHACYMIETEYNNM